MTTILSSPFIDIIPDRIRNSNLLQQGGFAIYEGIPDLRTQQSMLNEAIELSAKAKAHEVLDPDLKERKGGKPQRRYLSTTGGKAQKAFYQSGQTLQFLRQITNIYTLSPSGAQGTYTYYARQGDFLALHRDIEVCDLAVISVLYENVSSSGKSGSLCLYPGRSAEPLSSIRATPDQGAVSLQLTQGQTIVMLGGIVPHKLLPLGKDQVRIVSVLCYQA